ncbi:MAG: hypothetical protein FWH42_03420 [Dehalococcoidia bacterium]|nr:hypothetical protein [Dehalococcoidia bacterium]
MAEILAYKCPNCGAPLNFDSSSQVMKCASCGSEMATEAFKEYDAELQQTIEQKEPIWEDAEVTLWQDESIAMSICQSCGGELIMENTTVATECPYCGNAAVVPSKLTDTLRPDFVIPFKLDKNKAKEALKKFYKGKPLLPKAYLDDNRLDKISGIYVPFWLYDCDTNNHAVYNATKSSTWTSGNVRYTKTDYYMVSRDGKMGFEKIPADALLKMDDTMMESIEPYEYKDLTDFSMAYLSGYLADKYDVTAEQNQPRVNERIRKSVEKALRATVVGYSSVNTKVLSVNIANAQVHYALFPVWMLTTRWGKELFYFAMNGQTGRLVGTLPIDWKKGFVIGGVVLVSVTLILTIIMLLAHIASNVAGPLTVISLLVVVIVALSFIPLFARKKKKLNKNERGNK